MFIEDKTFEAIAGNTKAIEIASNTYVGGSGRLQQSLLKELAAKTKFGEDKKTAKDRAIEEHRAFCREQNEPFRITDVKLDGIYSHSTFKNYLSVGGRFLDYVDQNNLQARNIVDCVRKHGTDYLQSLEDRGLSTYTVGQAKACLSKIIGKELDYKLPPQHAHEITKGRQMSERCSLFNEDKNRELVEIARATGGRRSDLEKLRVGDFVREKGIITGVEFKDSKGGRDRYSPILPEHQKEVTKIVNEMERQGRDQAFDEINSMANIHSYRREYCREVYRKCQNDHSYRENLLKKYESKGFSMNEKDKAKEDYWASDGRTFNRQSLFISSQALGHNRLDIIPRNYFK